MQQVYKAALDYTIMGMLQIFEKPQFSLRGMPDMRLVLDI